MRIVTRHDLRAEAALHIIIDVRSEKSDKDPRFTVNLLLFLYEQSYSASSLKSSHSGSTT